MAYEDVTALLGGWDGFELVAMERTPAVGDRPPQVALTLRPVVGRVKRCSRCGVAVDAVHDTSVRRVRDLPILDAETWLLVPRARVQCPTCGPIVEAVDWLDRYQRMTTRLAEAIARLASQCSLTQVAAWYGVHWTTVKAIDQRALTKRLGPVDLDGLRVLAIDEFALHRGHRYATVVVDPLRKRVLWVGPGRSRAEVRPFFELLGPARCAQIEAVAMDMSLAYAAEVALHCPQAAPVYDLFHVVAKYGREVLDRVRVDETNKLAKAEGPNRPRVRAARRVIKGTRWLLLRNRATLQTPADHIRLNELLAANRALFICYVLKDDLKDLWRYRARWAAARAWRDWYRRAMRSRLAPLQAFAKNLRQRIDGVLNHCRFALHTGLLEGINNKIKVLKRIAYGYRDQDYFFLKIRAAFPGIP